jgi:hypothetical protein
LQEDNAATRDAEDVSSAGERNINSVKGKNVWTGKHSDGVSRTVSELGRQQHKGMKQKLSCSTYTRNNTSRNFNNITFQSFFHTSQLLTCSHKIYLHKTFYERLKNSVGIMTSDKLKTGLNLILKTSRIRNMLTYSLKELSPS